MVEGLLFRVVVSLVLFIVSELLVEWVIFSEVSELMLLLVILLLSMLLICCCIELSVVLFSRMLAWLVFLL